VQIRDQQLAAVYWNDVELKDQLKLPPDFLTDTKGGPGAIGLYLEKTHIEVQEFTLKILE
jgi:hypothetical protein